MITPLDFLNVVKNTPLVSIDLLVHNPQKHILVGKRINQPAMGYWFVPGGRIRKNEEFQAALIRLMKEELGVKHFSGSYTISGVYEHIYSDCFYKPNPFATNTHYISIAVNLDLNESEIKTDIFLKQHSQLRWMTPNEIWMDDTVHEYTKNFMNDNTYGIITY